MSTYAESVAAWLQPVPWQLVATLEFPWNARPETADRKFTELIDSVERGMRTRICYARALESRAKSGERVPLHIHAALASAKPIPHQLVSGIWNSQVGRTNSSNSDLAFIEPYNPSQCGIQYLLKQIDDPDCEWDFRNVHLFNPNVKLDSKLDHASLRSARRWQQQVSLASA
ncbi:MAG: hypothetical protein ABSE53_05650 [Terracidiphilus sp.]